MNDETLDIGGTSKCCEKNQRKCRLPTRFLFLDLIKIYMTKLRVVI